MSLIFDANGEPFQSAPVPVAAELPNHVGEAAALDDPIVWRDAPMYDPPADVDVAYWQAEVDKISGVTIKGESINIIVWNGDRTYWTGTYTDWDSYGEPLGDALLRPLVRFKVMRDELGRPLYDVFPPRWLLLSRIEPEQYPNYKTQSYLWDDELRCNKKMRPDTPPPVDWIWNRTIADHTQWCCQLKMADNKKCFGTYAKPSAVLEHLRKLKSDMEKEGFKGLNPFESFTGEDIFLAKYQENGYAVEVKNLQSSRQIALAHPHAFLGVPAIVAVDPSAAKTERIINDYFDRKLDDLNNDKLRRKIK